MASSQDYFLRFFSEVYGKENLSAMAKDIGEAAKQAKVAKDATESWNKAVEIAAREAGVSVGQLNKQIAENIRAQKDAKAEVDNLVKSNRSLLSVNQSLADADKSSADAERLKIKLLEERIILEKRLAIERQAAANAARYAGGGSLNAAEGDYRIAQENERRLIREARDVRAESRRAQYSNYLIQRAASSSAGGGYDPADEARRARIASRGAQRSAYLLQHEEEAASRIFGRVGGRVLGAEVLGRAAGIPGGGFIGSQLVGSLGLSGGAALGIGGGAVGLLAGYGAYKSAEDTSKYAQEQSNLAKELGMTVEETQLLGRVTEVTGIKTESMYKVLRDMNKELLSSGPEAKRVQTALSDLGISAGVAFLQPKQQLDAIFASLNKLGDETEKKRAVVKLFGESGLDLLPLAENFARVSRIVKDSGVIIGKDSIEALKGFREYSESIKLEWDAIGHKIGEASAAFFTLASESLLHGGGILSFINPGSPSFGLLGPRGGPSGPVPPSNLRPTYAERQAVGAGLSRLHDIRASENAGRDPVQFLRAELSDLQSQSSHLRDDALAGVGGGVAAYEDNQRQIHQKELGIREAEKLRSKQEQYRDLINKPIESDRDAIAVITRLAKDFPGFKVPIEIYRKAVAGAAEVGRAGFDKLVGEPTRGFAAETNPLSPLFGLPSTIQPGLNGSAQQQAGQDLERISRERFNADKEQKALQDQIAAGVTGLITGDIRNQQAVESAGASRGVALAAGQSRFGLTPAQSARLGLRQDLSAISAEYSPQLKSLQGQAYVAQTEAFKLPVGSDERTRLEKDARDALIDIEVKETEARTKAIEAVNKFNESIDKAAESVRNQFSGGLESIILGSQRGGSGAKSAIRGFGEQIEGQLLHNIGDRIYGDPSKGTGASGPLQRLGSKLPDWLTKGTIFGQIDKKIDPVTAAEGVIKNAHEDANRIIAAIERLRGVGGSGSGEYGTFNPPNDDGSGEGGPSDGSDGGGVVGAATSAANKVAGLVSAIKSGNPASVAKSILSSLSKFGKGFGTGLTESGDINAITNNYEGETRSEQIGAIAGTAAIGFGAYSGIARAAKGGARNVSAGIGESLGALAAIPGPQQPFIAGAAAIASIVAAVLPDPKVVRAQQISKAIFTQQYLAPQAINMTASGSGGYADVDIYGGVRNSRFSPYPITAGSYEDVPRRTVVPGGTISTFGGTGTPLAGTGAMRPQVPTPVNVTVQVQTLDSRSFNDNAHLVAGAVHLALQEGHEPMIRTIRSQLGLGG